MQILGTASPFEICAFGKIMKDSVWNHNPAKFLKECKRLRALSQRIVDGEESIIEGSREMFKYMFWMKEDKNETWSIFRLIVSESDHLPVGSVRQYWDQDALIKQDEEIRAVEDFYRSSVIDAARKIYEEYKKYVEQVP